MCPWTRTPRRTGDGGGAACAKGKKKNTDAVDTDSIVKELNQKHSKKIAEKKQSAPEKAKSLDEIVDKATEEADPKKTDPSEVFTVTDAQMEAGVADYKLPAGIPGDPLPSISL